MNKRKNRILVVDNDKAICWVLEKAFSGEDFIVDVAMNGRQALEKIDENKYALVIMDVMMPVMDGIKALEYIKKMPDRPETIIMTGHSSMENTIEAMKLGAYEYIVKPFDIDEIIELAEKAIEKYLSRSSKSSDISYPNQDIIIGNSPKMREIYKILGRIAPTDSTVLITGETGTGKDLIARAIHYHSLRKGKPFVTVNCASIPGELLESELFGHVRGAFTGAISERKGKCELADGGTLFLDEIGSMRKDLQAKLLIFLQRSEFERVGSSETIRVNVRVIASTNADFRKMTAQGEFREDLYYRLMVVPIHIPPLRERKEDIGLLAEYFTAHYNSKYNLDFKLTSGLKNELISRDWPGNVRELENYIHKMVVLQSNNLSTEDDKSIIVPGGEQYENISYIVSDLVNSGAGDLLNVAHEKIEKPLLLKVMSKTGDNQSEAARILGISRNTLRKLLEKYGLNL